MQLLDQHVLVMGGSNGMGLATAQHAARAGARVTLVGRSEARLLQAAERVRASTDPDGVSIAVADFTDDDSLAELFKGRGAVDHLVLAASNQAAWGPFADIDRAALMTAMEHKLVGYWATLRAALPVLRRDGSVVMLGGAASRTAMPGTAGLAAVNGGITQMAQTLARELAPLRVNVVSPGLVDTPAYDAMPEAERRQMFDAHASGLPVGHIGDSDDIGAAVVMLLANPFATGVLLDIDGGARMAA